MLRVGRSSSQRQMQWYWDTRKNLRICRKSIKARGRVSYSKGRKSSMSLRCATSMCGTKWQADLRESWIRWRNIQQSRRCLSRLRTECLPQQYFDRAEVLENPWWPSPLRGPLPLESLVEHLQTVLAKVWQSKESRCPVVEQLLSSID